MRIVAKKRHNEDKKLHNSEEKLHNSDISNDEGPDLAWQEAVDLLPEDEVEASSEIYYFTDEDGNIHSREFLVQELVPSDDEDLKDLRKRKPSYEKVERLKPGTLDMVALSRRPQQTSQKIALPVPKSGTRPLDIRISSEVAPDLSTKESQRLNEGIDEDKHVIVHLHDGYYTDKPSNAVQDRKVDEPLRLSFTQAELKAYVVYRSEGLAKKSKDWINRSSEALWESTRGEISHQTTTGLRTFVLSKYSSVDAHRKVLGFAAAFLKYLAQMRVEPRYLSFTLFLERPKTTKFKKAITERIVTREDIAQLFDRIDVYGEKGKISAQKMRNYRVFFIPCRVHRITAQHNPTLDCRAIQNCAQRREASAPCSC